MISLSPVSEESVFDFAETSFEEMSPEEKLQMLRESEQKVHKGAYFELLAVRDGEKIVGFMSLCAHSEHIISISPEIKSEYRNMGYGYQGERLALGCAKDAGYTIALASVREDNPASIALHEKLGFEVGAHCLSSRGFPILIFVKTL